MQTLPQIKFHEIRPDKMGKKGKKRWNKRAPNEHYLCIHIFQTFELSIHAFECFWFWENRDLKFQVKKFLKNCFLIVRNCGAFPDIVDLSLKKLRKKNKSLTNSRFKEKKRISSKVNYHFIRSCSCPATNSTNCETAKKANISPEFFSHE